MTEPQDPFAAPGGQPPAGDPAPAGYGPPPGYDAPPAGYGPPPPGYGAPAQQPYGAMPAGGPVLASWGRRAGGFLIDAAIIYAAELVVAQISFGLARVAGIAVGVFFGYLVGTTGQSPGKKALGIKVLRMADGGFLGGGLGIGRYFLHFLDALPLGLGFLWPLWDSKNQTFADKLVSSVAVRA